MGILSSFAGGLKRRSGHDRSFKQPMHWRTNQRAFNKNRAKPFMPRERILNDLNG
jgi:hypothetical protein